MVLETLDDHCSCVDCTNLNIQVSMQKAAITAVILGPLGVALHFWLKKKRLIKHLSKVQGKCAAIYQILQNDANKLRKKYEDECQKSTIQDSRLTMPRLDTTEDIPKKCRDYSLPSKNPLVVSTGLSNLTPSTDDVKRLENAVENLTRGMKITNKRLLQLSEQVVFLRKKLEDQSQQYSKS